MITIRAREPRFHKRRATKKQVERRCRLGFEALEQRLPFALPALETEVVANLSSPVVATHADDGSGRIFVAELGGQIRIVDDGILLPTPFLSLSVVTGVERGLLGLAFHPDYATDGADGEGLFYAYYSSMATMGGDHDSVIAEFSVSSTDPNQADVHSQRIVLRFNQPFANHNGGELKFGPDDGLLYISSGDGGGSGDPQGNGQNLNTLLGKILRIDIDSGDAFLEDPNRNFAIPPTNPFINDPNARDEIFAYGLRNPYRMSFDDGTNGAASPDRLFVGDVGQDLYEEVDIVTAGGNYGWDVCEADHVFGNPSQPCPTGFVKPIAEYDHNVGESVIGGFVYRGARFPELNGVYLFGDLNGTTMALEQQGSSFVLSPLTLTGVVPDNIIGFGEDESGELYILTFSQMLGFTRTAADADKIGVHRNNQFLQDVNGNGSSDTGDRSQIFGNPTDLAVVGDWDGDGRDEIGVRRAALFYLDFNGNGAWNGTGGGDRLLSFGSSSDLPIIGDWDGDGDDDVGVQRLNQFYLDRNGNGVWDSPMGGDLLYTFGNPGDDPLSGDWDGDGDHEIGVHRGRQFYLDRNSNGAWNGPTGGDLLYNFGIMDDTPIVGDWNATGTDKIGVHRGNKFYRDNNGNGVWNGPTGGDLLHTFGNPEGDQPLAGKWRPVGALLAERGTVSASDVGISLTGDPLSGDALTGDALTGDALALIMQRAIVIWADTGLSSSHLQTLQSLHVAIADLSGEQLGLSLGGTILLESDAAGFGWFVDPTPADNSEFDSTLPLSAGGSPPGMDLLSVVLHELGHELGFDHDDGFEVMLETLAIGTRRLP